MDEYCELHVVSFLAKKIQLKFILTLTLNVVIVKMPPVLLNKVDAWLPYIYISHTHTQTKYKVKSIKILFFVYIFFSLFILKTRHSFFHS